jgi:hypothetical protein
MISEQERAWEHEADLYRATEVRTMETVIWITRELDDQSLDIEVAVEVEVSAYGVKPSDTGMTVTGYRAYQLTKAEMDRAADQAWQEAHEE